MRSVHGSGSAAVRGLSAERSSSQKALQQLREQCQDLKSTANALSEENLKMRTRVLALDRELQRRQRLLKQLAAANDAGIAVSVDLIEKLREERNMIPAFKKKASDLQAQIGKKDQEIREIKRDPCFTRIIELQVEYATWQHELQRLEGLLQEPSEAASEAARSEIEAHERRALRLADQLDAAEEQRLKAIADLADVELTHSSLLQSYNESEAELLREQQDTQDLAEQFRSMLQERRTAENLQAEVEAMALSLQRCNEDIREEEVARAAAAERAALEQAPTSILRVGSEPGPEAAVQLRALGRFAAQLSGQGSLIRALLLQDQDKDGLITDVELGVALSEVGYGVSQDELQALSSQLPKELAPLRGEEQLLRQLSLLLLADAATPGCTAPTELPPLRSLRVGCLRACVGHEEFQERLRAVAAPSQARAFFFDFLQLPQQDAEAWMRCWSGSGSADLLLRLPLSEVAPSQGDFYSWYARCVAAAARCQELQESLCVWNADMQLTEDQFKMVATDILPSLSAEDIDELILYAASLKEPGIVDGTRVFALRDQL